MVVDGYIRVSQLAGRGGERFISPLAQRERIEAWATAHGAAIGNMFEELDESGARPDRPLLVNAIERVERGESEGLVVSKLDRFGRSLVDGVTAIDRIQAAGGVFVSVEDGLDLSTDTGRLVLRIMLSMAEWELDRVRAGWLDAKARAIARGVHVGPFPPFGYRKGDDGRLYPDAATAPLLKQCFRMRAQRATSGQIGGFLEEHRARTSRGSSTWCNSTVRKMFGSRVYLGEVRCGSAFNARAHEPLVDRATWQLVQEGQELRAPRRSSPSLLRGLLRCWACRRTLSSGLTELADARPYRSYMCTGESTSGRCPARCHVSALKIEPHVEAIFWQELETHARRARAAARELAKARGASEACELALSRYRDNERVLATIGPRRFEQGLRVRTQRAERAELALASARARVERDNHPPVPELRGRWSSMSVDERRHEIAKVIDCVFVRKGGFQPVAPRCFICLRGEAPPGLPTGRGSGPPLPLVPFDPRDCPHATNPRLRKTRRPRWPAARVRRELVAFVGERRTIPTFEQFQEAGQAELFEQVRRRGGMQRWARQIGVPYCIHTPVRRRWSEERIRAELSEFLTGWTTWPTRRQFKEAGRSTLRSALDEQGRSDRWRREYGLPLQPRGKRRTWPDERLEAELLAFVRGRTVWPSRAEFKQAGLRRLHEAAYVHGGHNYWATRFGLRRQRRINTEGKPFRWE